MRGHQETGLAPALDFRGFLDLEEHIARQFSTIFRINFARVQEFKNKKYAFILARPTQTYLQRYLFENRELLILFTRDIEFDGRLFDFVDHLNTQFQNRIDRLCMILVANNDKLPDRVDQYARQQTEARLVIPVTFNEADGDLENLIEQRLNQFVFGRDLFAFSSPLKTDTYFFGRKGILQFIYEKYRNGENAGLFGLRKVGKTSVLHAVQRWLDAREEPSVLIDCQDTAVHLRSWNELLYVIFERIVYDLNLGFLKSRLDANRYAPEHASRSFESDLTEVSKFYGNKRILILFDEIESITFDLSSEERWRNGTHFLLFWKTIRAIYQRHSDLFSFVLTGVNPKAIETPLVAGTDNPIFRIVSPTYLDFFTHEEVAQMVSVTARYMGLAFDAAVLTYLANDFGGHPFLVRQACSKLHQRLTERPGEITQYFYAEVRPDIERELHSYVEQIVSVLRTHYSTEFELLELLALGEKDEFERWAVEAPSIIDHLRGYGLVHWSGKNHHITIRCVKDYLAERSKTKVKLSTKEQRQLEVSETRNRLESLLRKTIRFVLRAHLGPNAGKDALLEVMFPKQREKMRALGFDEILTASYRELYLLDLMRVTLKNWGSFHAVFGSEKAKFEEFITVVNRLRVDAHDHDISDDDLGIFRIATSWLIEKCVQFLGSDAE